MYEVATHGFESEEMGGGKEKNSGNNNMPFTPFLCRSLGEVKSGRKGFTVGTNAVMHLWKGHCMYGLGLNGLRLTTAPVSIPVNLHSPGV